MDSRVKRFSLFGIQSFGSADWLSLFQSSSLLMPLWRVKGDQLLTTLLIR